MANCIYVAWQNPNTQDWHVVGQLLHTDQGYEFRYTKGIHSIPNFQILSNMPEHEKVYYSPELFSLFKNRLMPKSRPEYSRFMSWMAMAQEDRINELDVLAISGGERETDFFRIISVPKKNPRGDYGFKFFASSLNVEGSAKDRIENLKKGEPLYLLNEKNPLELWADGACLIGYVPPYFEKAIHKMQEHSAKAIRVNVVQVNKDAPLQMRLLCELSSPLLDKPWEAYDDDFKLISGDAL